jgi:stage V sporulation protein R
MLTNSGEPFIYVRDGNFRNRGELLLHHKWDGTPLKMDYAQDVLQALERVWKRPVNLETKYEDEGVLLHFDGDAHEHEEWEYEEI